MPDDRTTDEYTTRVKPTVGVVVDATDDTVGYTFGGRPAIAEVRPGELLRIRTRDCFGGAVRSVNDLPSKVCTYPYLNPVTGPFHVTGANPGDTLAVHIVSLTPTTPYGFSSTFPHFGALTSTPYTPTLQPPLLEQLWPYDIDAAAQVVQYYARSSDYTVELPLEPMLGTVGVAPAAGEVRMSIVPDAHGGNLDTPLLRQGTTLYLGVNEPGALLAFGDGHARQGDGEASGVAVEVAMDVVCILAVISGVSTPWPRMETDRYLMSVGIARPLEDAYRISQHDLVTQVGTVTGLDPLDSYQLVSQAGQARVGNVVDPNYTMVARIAKRLIGGDSPYGAAHVRLRADATAAW